MREDIHELKGTISYMMEMLEALTTKEAQPQLTMILEINIISVEP